MKLPDIQTCRDRCRERSQLPKAGDEPSPEGTFWMFKEIKGIIFINNKK
jgi:hypothetical protein